MADRRPAQAAAGLLLAAVLPLGGCATGSDLDRIQQRLADIQLQVVELGRQGSSKEEVAELGAKLSQQMQVLIKAEADMRVELANLSGQIESLQAKLDDTGQRLAQLSQQIAAANQELRAARAPSADASGASSPGSPSPVPAPLADPEALYQAAYSDYLRGAYDLARRGFEEYLRSFADTDLADNALYWIGECAYREGKYQEAIAAYDRVVERFPRSDKVPSALLKKGYALLELGRREAGVSQLRAVVRQYANSDEANLARQRLKALGVDSGGRRGQN